MPVNDFDLEVHPKRIAAGGILLIEITAPPNIYQVEWAVEGPVRFTHREVTIALLVEEVAVTGPVEFTGEPLKATLDTSSLVPGAWTVGVTLTPLLPVPAAPQRPRPRGRVPPRPPPP